MSELFTTSGRLLIQIIENPDTTIKDLSKDLFLTRRTIWGIIGELRKMGYLIIRKQGKTHHYTISAFGLAELRKLTEGGGG